MATTKQTNKRVAAAVIADQLSTVLEGYWAEQWDDADGIVDLEWLAEVTDQMQRILNPVFERLEKITKDFHVTDVEPKRKDG